jgi:hypothetical protein
MSPNGAGLDSFSSAISSSFVEICYLSPQTKGIDTISTRIA